MRWVKQEIMMPERFADNNLLCSNKQERSADCQTAFVMTAKGASVAGGLQGRTERQRDAVAWLCHLFTQFSQDTIHELHSKASEATVPGRSLVPGMADRRGAWSRRSAKPHGDINAPQAFWMHSGTQARPP